MLVPVVILFVAIASAAGMSYGTDPRLAEFGGGGISAIMLARRIEWPLITLCLVMCLSLLALVVSGRRRAWWLIGLAPVLALFVHRFATGPQNRFAVAENPAMVSVEKASFVRPEDYVVGLTVNDDAYAYPYAALYSTPLVVQQDRGRRVVLLWSPYANVARAWVVTHEISGRELHVVGMPANALLTYNARLGEFINGITGLTQHGARPTGFQQPIAAEKMPWKRWLAEHPSTHVMLPPRPIPADAPRMPILPTQPMPPGRAGVSQTKAPTGSTRVVLVLAPGAAPVAVPQRQISPADPLNVNAGDLPVLLLRDPTTGQIRAFERRLDEDLMPRFVRNRDRKRKEAFMLDLDTNTGWTADGVAVDGDKKRRGQKLKPVPIEDSVDLSVLKFWIPDLRVIDPGSPHPA